MLAVILISDFFFIHVVEIASKCSFSQVGNSTELWIKNTNKHQVTQ